MNASRTNFLLLLQSFGVPSAASLIKHNIVAGQKKEKIFVSLWLNGKRKQLVCL
jgi:hypothetical protein